MRRFRRFALRQPLLTAILLVASSLVVEVLAGSLVAVVFRVRQADPAFAPLVLLITTLYLIYILWTFGWLKPAAVATFGTWSGWGAALVMLFYYLVALVYSFFGEFDLGLQVNGAGALRAPILLIGVAFEEVLFRGMILYVLVCAWGETRKGLLKAVGVSALLFGLIHGANAIAGDRSEVLGQIAIALFEGVWWAAIVLRWGSIWPVVLIHWAANWVLQTKALEYAGFHGTARSYALAVLLGLPLVTLGAWWISRSSLRYQHDAAGPNAPARNGL